MARKLFGTDGVRGVAGEFLTAELALALGRAATRQTGVGAPAGADRPRHARVRRDARGGVAAGRQRGRRGCAARRRAADAGRAAADRPLRLRPGGRAVGLAQPLSRTTASSSSPATATSSPTRPSWRSSASCDARGRHRRRRAGDRAHPRAARRAARTTCASCTRAFAELDLHGLDVLLDCANGATYQVAPEIFRRLGATVTVIADDARRAQHQRRLRLHARRGARAARCWRAATRSASPSTATATACWPSTARGAVVDGDELMALAALHLRDTGRLAGDGVAVTVMTNYGFHAAMERAGVAVAHDAGRRPLRARGAARARLDARRASSPGTSSRWASTAPATASPARCSTLEALGGRDLSERDAMQKLPQRLVNVRVRDRDALEHAAGGRRRRCAAAEQALRGPRARAGAPERHRAARAGDGRGAHRAGGRGGLRAPGRARRARARLSLAPARRCAA